MSDSTARSAVIAMPARPSPSTSPTRECKALVVRAVTTTSAPALANVRAIARPIPWLAPVTSATLPSRRPTELPRCDISLEQAWPAGLTDRS
jgi:hypothetical protein